MLSVVGRITSISSGVMSSKHNAILEDSREMYFSSKQSSDSVRSSHSGITSLMATRPPGQAGMGSDGRAEACMFPERTWHETAFVAPYVAFNPRLLELNAALCDELLVACHVVNVSPPGDRDGERQDDVAADPSLFVSAAADTFALDRQCLVCRTVDLYRQRYGLPPQWAIDYAFLCAKCLCAPHCATSIFIAAFEFVYVMDRHFLPKHRATLVGAFARFALTVNDVHKHFFLHCCFRTDGGMPALTRDRQAPAAGAAKVRYSNYSFLAQSATRALLETLGAEQDGPSPCGGPQPALTTALMNWKDCARLLDCTERKGARADSCCVMASRSNDEFEEAQPEGWAETAGSDADWAHADLTLLLLADTPSVWQPCARTLAAADARRATVERAWLDHATARERDTAPRFAQFSSGARPAVDLGPRMATVLKHNRGRGKTGGECVLCNLMLVRAYWLAMRRFKTRVIRHSVNNSSLFDCITPVLDQMAADPAATPNDGGRLISLLRAAGPEAIFKHMFCDPMCAITDMEVNPWVLFKHPSAESAEELALFKTRLACDNRFEGRVCMALRALVYTFKTYQVFVPRPTALATFVRDAGALLRRHSLSLLSLEHTLSAYV
ncbi:DNA packaging protein UL32 [Leporid alphaherpesvirus 4]|uniref:Packaging protein UL32 n=1 Tax=Leporid alphaherpesvirus 4 TaxID=481315 RepID=J9QYN5_9ALPH|nr:DNA packaging protein UL32 [Leporid alphaherpesvirus 4]AFR32473.1 DNA packaging protein UL32 [Leporid alphaherpesvirus 4]